MERVCDKGKCQLGEGAQGSCPHGSRCPQTKTTVTRDHRALLDLYHNPDPLV